MKHFLTLLIAVLSLLPSTMKAAGNKVITSLTSPSRCPKPE